MPRPLSNDIRKRIVEAVQKGLSRNAAAQKYDVAPSSAIKIVALWKKTGSWEPKQIGGYRRHILADHTDKVNQLLEEKPDITLAEMQAALAKDNIKVGQSSISRFFNHLGLTYKKNGARQRTKSRGCKEGA